MKRLWMMLLVLLLVSACQPAAQNEDDGLPTLAALPTDTPTNTPTDTPEPTDTPVDTDTPTPTETATDTPTPEDTPTSTSTATQTPLPSATVNQTQAVIGTATASIEEAPVLQTLTPIPEGEEVAVRPTSTGTPEIVADVIITERQYQEEVDRLIESIDSIEEAEINFVADGIEVELRALGGEAFTVGTVRYNFSLQGDERAVNNFLIIQPDEIEDFEMLSGEEPSDTFIDVAYGDMFQVMFEAFDFILNQRLGEGQHDLEFLTITDEQMGIVLFVPES